MGKINREDERGRLQSFEHNFQLKKQNEEKVKLKVRKRRKTIKIKLSVNKK